MKHKSKKYRLSKNETKKTPLTAGVYTFWSGSKRAYIGKANNLKSRIGSYLQANLTRKTAQMIKEADSFSYLKVSSEIEALLLEAKLIRKYKPRYNINLRDDKKPLYIQITKEKFPRVITARKSNENSTNILFLGPFPDSAKVKTVLKIIRKIFPFSDHKLGKRGCLYSQIGLCNPCPNLIFKERDLAKYKKNIKNVIQILNGNFKGVRKKLENEMLTFSQKEEFENAAVLRNKIQSLDYITQPVNPISGFIKNPNFLEDIRREEIAQLQQFISIYTKISSKLNRIECYDVSHLSGTKSTASMVTFVKGEPEKSLYRRFRIRQLKGNDDIASLAEVAERRVKNIPNWGKPDLIIVDGGKAQVNAFRKVLKKNKILVVGIAKRFESLIIPVNNQNTKLKQLKIPRGPALFLVQRLRDEAHRFARSYHHKLINKTLLSN